MSQNPNKTRPPRRRRKLLTGVVTLALLGGAAAGAWFGATAAADAIEARTRIDMRTALTTAGQDWAEAEADGLRVTLRGTAPSEVARLRAIAAAGTVVQSGRIHDQIEVAAPARQAPPDFQVELLANDAGISLVGLVPATTDRDGAMGTLRAAGAPQVSDLLAVADHPAGTDWAAAFQFGLRAASIAPRSKISIQPGAVAVAAIASDPREKARIETELQRARPAEVQLSTDIRAPLPVISPFTLRLVMDDEGAHFDACAADSEAARARILAAAGAAGVAQPGCALGIGAPSGDWSAAAAAGINALAQLGAGTLTLSDLSVALSVPDAVPEAAFDEQVGRLEAALPDAFTLTALREAPPQTSTTPVEFSASRPRDGGTTTLRGRITDDHMREAVESLARARFGVIDSALRLDEAAPGGWTVRVVGALEALSALEGGRVVVTPDLVQVEGVSGSPEASDEVAARLGARLGPGARYALRIAYDRRLDPVLGLPDGETCVARMNAVLDGAEIRFAPNQTTITGDIEATLEALAGAMQNCEDFRIEIGGHTDSQGSEGWNQQLSDGRARAVLRAMTEAGIPVANLTALGYGESQPIATNETEAGREQNRRIEMRLIAPEPVGAEAPVPGALVTGVTEDVEDDATAGAIAQATATGEPGPSPQPEPQAGIEVGAAAPGEDEYATPRAADDPANAAMDEAAPDDTATDPAAQDMAQQDDAAQDAAPQDDTTPDAASQDTTAQDAAAQDATVRDQSATPGPSAQGNADSAPDSPTAADAATTPADSAADTGTAPATPTDGAETPAPGYDPAAPPPELGGPGDALMLDEVVSPDLPAGYIPVQTPDADTPRPAPRPAD